MDDAFDYLLSDFEISEDETMEMELDFKVPQYQFPSSFNIFELYMNAFFYFPFQNKNKVLSQEFGPVSFLDSDFLKVIQSDQKSPFSNQNDIKLNEDDYCMPSKLSFVRTFDTSSAFQQFISAIEQNSEISLNRDSKYQIYEKILDRNIEISEMIKLLANTAVPTISTIMIENADDVKTTIENNLSSVKSYEHPPILFYTDYGIQYNSGFDVPYKMLISRKYPTVNQEQEEKLKAMPSLINRYFKLAFIIASENGIPFILFFGINSILKIYEGTTVAIKSKQKIFQDNTIIYALFYCLDGLNVNLATRNRYTSNSAGIHPEINNQVDHFLLDLIQYKYKNSWTQKRNFLDFIIEAIRYPAFFGVSFGYEISRPCFIASILIGTDENSKESILNNIKTEEKKEIVHIIHMYGKFTFFVLYFIKFLNLINTNCKDDNELKKYCALLFRSIPANNKVFFDYFVAFMKEAIKLLENRNQKAIASTFNYFLAVAVLDYSFPEMKKNNVPSLRDAFEYYLNPERMSPVGAVKTLNELCNNPEIKNLFTFEKKLKDPLVYNITPNFNEFLSCYFNPIQIYV